MKPNVFYICLLCIFFLNAYACKTVSAQEETAKASYEVLISGSNGKGQKTAVIENQNELNNLYERLYGAGQIKAPEIDFKKNKVIAVFVGRFNTGGYTVEPYSIACTRDIVEAVFSVRSPAPDQIVTQAFTYPYILIRIAASPSTRISIKIEGIDKEFLY